MSITLMAHAADRPSWARSGFGGGGSGADSLHPGENVTGLSMMATELYPKRLQLLKEVPPSLLAHAAAHSFLRWLEELEIPSRDCAVTLSVSSAFSRET
jgi:hypothetical protein